MFSTDCGQGHTILWLLNQVISSAHFCVGYIYNQKWIKKTHGK